MEVAGQVLLTARRLPSTRGNRGIYIKMEFSTVSGNNLFFRGRDSCPCWLSLLKVTHAKLYTWFMGNANGRGFSSQERRHTQLCDHLKDLKSDVAILKALVSERRKSSRLEELESRINMIESKYTGVIQCRRARRRNGSLSSNESTRPPTPWPLVS